MAKKILAAIFLFIVLFSSFIVTMPILIFSNEFSDFGKIDNFDSYYYTSSNVSTTEKLNLDIIKGEVKIKYVDPSYDYSVKIDVYVEIAGAKVLGNSYLDYFDVIWENYSSPLNFTMLYKSGIDPIEASSLIKNISIVVLLKEDMIFDINTDLKEGNININIPFGVSTNNIKVNVERGNIVFDFIYCVIGGNISGSVNVGNIIFRLYDVQYTRNCFWNLTLGNGDMLIDIIQDKDIGANITGSGEINTGELRVLYKDYNPNVGALFIFHSLFGEMGIVEGFREGENEIDEEQWWLSRFLFYSYGFPGLNYYNISLYRPNNPPDSGYVYNLLNTNNTI